MQPSSQNKSQKGAAMPLDSTEKDRNKNPNQQRASDKDKPDTAKKKGDNCSC